MFPGVTVHWNGISKSTFNKKMAEDSYSRIEIFVIKNLIYCE